MPAVAPKQRGVEDLFDGSTVFKASFISPLSDCPAPLGLFTKSDIPSNIIFGAKYF